MRMWQLMANCLIPLRGTLNISQDKRTFEPLVWDALSRKFVIVKAYLFWDITHPTVLLMPNDEMA